MQLLCTSRITKTLSLYVVVGVVLGGGLISTRSSFAQDQGNKRASLVSRIEGLAGEFSPPSDEMIAGFQAELGSALAELDEYLRRGVPGDRERWREYLGWDDLVTLASGRLDTDVLKNCQDALRAGHQGLERPSFVRVRKAIDQLRVSTVVRSAADRFGGQYATRIGQLAKMVADPNTEWEAINKSITTLRPLGLPAEIENAIRSEFFLPNLRILAEGDFLAKTFTRPISRSMPVSESLLGTRFSGTSVTNGTATLRLVPSRNSARFCVLFDGQTVSDACGTQKPVQVSSRSVTQAHASKGVTLDATGFSSNVATANCSTRSRVRWIRSMRKFASRLIERVAYRKAEQQRPLAQRIASRRAEKRIGTMMDDQTNDLLAQMNGRFRNRFRPRLTQRAIYPRWVHYSTSSRQLCIQALQGQRDQLGSPTPAPDMPPHSISIQVHESLPANTAASFMSGMNLMAAMASELAEKIAGDRPTDIQADAGWSVLFDLQNPVTLSFRDNGVRIAMTARRFSRGSDNLNRVMRISATYGIVQADDGFVLRRSPEIDVALLDNRSDRLSPSDIAQRELMKNVFASVFSEEFSTDSLRMPERFEKMKDLKLQYISSENGWLSLGWN